jgi:mycothiol synthase
MRFRAPVVADAPAVLAVLEARDLADLGETEYRLEDLIDEWQGSDLDLESSARVVEVDGGRIAAYAAVRRPGTLAVVAPGDEGRGIGSRLLEWAESRDRERGRDVYRQWVAATNASARALLTRAGYRRTHSYWRMVRSLEDDPSAPDAPAGFALRAVDPVDDVLAMHAVDDASFASAPDYTPESLTEFIESHLEAHDFDAGSSRVVTEAGRIVGFLLAGPRREERVGWVHVLAVDPGYQDRGLGTAMLRSAFAAFAQAGLREARLGVASYNARGLHVYERVGMTARYRFDIWERPVGSDPSRWRSYRDVDAADDPASLANQLDAIASVSFVAAEKRRSLELLGLGPGHAVLDVGCGTGAELEPLAGIVGTGGRVVGLERSAALIAAARARGRDRPRAVSVELVEGDVRSLPFDVGEFDACRADRTLQHVDPPEAGLREMIRVTRPGGRVVVSESRWGLVAPDLDQDVTDRILGRLASETQQAEWLGFRLPAMFEQAGLTDVQTVSADYTASERDELWRFTHLRASVKDAVRAGALAEEDGTAWAAQLDELIERGEAFAVVLILHVTGTKPPD